jgi:hypothetical protein
MASQNTANKGFTAKIVFPKDLWGKAKLPAGLPGLFLDSYFKYSGLRGTNTPTIFPFD